ncbi:MAG: hypothetical protein ACQEQY_02550 [Halobacteriota archaeon]
MPRQDGHQPFTSPTVHRWAWIFVAVFFVGGDFVTTSLGLSVAGVVERNSFLAPLVAEYGVVVILVLKAIVVGTGYAVYRHLPRPHDVGVPLGFATVGVAVTGWNVVVLWTALLA